MDPLRFFKSLPPEMYLTGRAGSKALKYSTKFRVVMRFESRIFPRRICFRKKISKKNIEDAGDRDFIGPPRDRILLSMLLGRSRENRHDWNWVDHAGGQSSEFQTECQECQKMSISRILFVICLFGSFSGQLVYYRDSRSHPPFPFKSRSLIPVAAYRTKKITTKYGDAKL